MPVEEAGGSPDKVIPRRLRLDRVRFDGIDHDLEVLFEFKTGAVRVLAMASWILGDKARCTKRGRWRLAHTGDMVAA